MRKSIIIPLLISLVLVLSPSTSSGQTTSSTSVEELQKQLQLLLSQISSLQKEVTTLKSATPASPATSVTTPIAPTPTASTPAPTSILPPSLYSPIDIDESEVGETETQFVPPPILTRSLFRGSRGEDVRQLQEFLAQDPTIYPEGIATGYYGLSTERAMRKWQAKNGVPAVGIVGRQTIAKFKELYQGRIPPKLITDPDYPIRNPNVCAVYSPIVCPAGEERYSVSDPSSYSSCPIYACRPAGTKKEICP
ncbi:MAG: peptidoglycan-binding domain-containing protein, partial [Patescibacteria group bacterium]